MTHLPASPPTRGGWQYPVAMIAVLLALIWLAAVPDSVETEELWWQLAVGRQIAESGTIPTTNVFAYTMPAEQSYVYQGWLADLILYGTYRLGGLALLDLLRGALVVLGYGLLGWLAWRRGGGSAIATIAALIGAALLGLGDWGLSGRSFSLPLLAGLLLALDGYIGGYAGRRALFVPPVLIALWANLDWGVVAGLAALLGLGVGALIGLWRREPGHLPRARLRPLLLCVLLSLVAVVVNPLGLGIISYLQQTLNANAPTILGFAWQPPTIASDLKGTLFFITLLSLPLLWRWRGQRPSAPHLGALIALCWLAIGSWQAVIFFGAALVPALATALSPAAPTSEVTRPGGRRASVTAAVVVASLVLMFVMPWLSRMSFSGGRPLTFDEEGRDSPTRVVRALQVLREQRGAEGHLFHDVRYGGYLMWALPEERTFVDPRHTLFSSEIWDDYVRLTVNCELDLLAERYDVRRLLLDRSSQQALVEAARADPRWELVFEWGSTLLFARR